MKKMLIQMMIVLMFSVFVTCAAFAMDKSHDMGKSDKFGDLIHESMVDGYALAYYFMDMRNQNKDKKDTGAHGTDHTTKEMDKPHHLMVYIMDVNKKQIHKGKVGFMIKNDKGIKQTAMGMFMSNGFGATADMKKKGVYTIVVKAILRDKKLMDSFEYTIE